MAGTPWGYRGRQRGMQTMLRLGAAVARRQPLLRGLAHGAGERMIMACALGGDVPLFDEEFLPATVLVRGGPAVERYVLYEADDPAETNRARFRPLDLASGPLFGGGIRVFRTENREHDRAYFVRAFRGDRFQDSDIMAAPIRSQPTRHFAGGLVMSRAGAVGAGPTFEWGAITTPRWVSFLVLRGERAERAAAEGLLAAVYAWGPGWRYPDLDAAPFHYTASDAGGGVPSVLPPDAEALYFAVQRDGWISAFARCLPGEAPSGERAP